MNRQEAHNKIYKVLETLDTLEMGIYADDIAEALESLTRPDPDTGLIPCGCGGKADCNDTGIMSKDGKPLWWVECTGCGISTYGHQQKDEAKAAWNQAMSGAAQ